MQTTGSPLRGLILVAAFRLAGCAPAVDTAASPDTDETDPRDTDTSMPADPSFDLRVRDLGFASTYLHHDDGAGWTSLPGDAMAQDGAWQRYTRDVDPEGPFGSTFTFNDGASTWYPGGSDNNYRASGRDVWVSDGLMYTHDVIADAPPADEFTVLTINLHTYQEAYADAALDHVVDVIAAVGADLVALQECAQSKDAVVVEDHLGVALKSDNMARRIAKRLQERHGLDYAFYWDWHHYGFDTYEEGLAVMAPATSTMRAYGSSWVSTSESVYDALGARKVVYATFDTPHGPVVLASAHLSWGTDQYAQIDRARAVLEGQITPDVRAAFVAGDFNADSRSGGYTHMTEDGQYTDTYVAANGGLTDNGFDDPTTDEGTRIDYVFAYNGTSEGAPAAITSQRVFFDLGGAGHGHASLQRVSDHRGVVVRFSTAR